LLKERKILSEELFSNVENIQEKKEYLQKQKDKLQKHNDELQKHIDELQKSKDKLGNLICILEKSLPIAGFILAAMITFIIYLLVNYLVDIYI
jgi:hypothetical protein